eukprot:10697974-Heterocapsa_arctica.AAC.1
MAPVPPRAVGARLCALEGRHGLLALVLHARDLAQAAVAVRLVVEAPGAAAVMQALVLPRAVGPALRALE